MTDDPTIQCENCGTIYSASEVVCPYCGQPQPFLPDEELLFQEAYDDDVDDLPPAEGPPLDQDEFLLDDEYADYPAEMPLEEEYPAPPDEEYLADGYLPRETGLYEDDDRFAEAEAEWPEDYGEYDTPYDDYDAGAEPYYDEYGDTDDLYDDYGEPDEYDAYEAEEEAEPRRFTKRRIALGCVGIFLCAGLFYAGIGLLGVYHGLQERSQLIQIEAETHYQKGQEHLADNSFELAIAEFELALSLNPNLLAAREALRDAQRVAQAQPTPTSETRSAAAGSILSTAETQVAQENWAEAVETLTQLRELDPDYQADRVSELIYIANSQLGLQLITPDQLETAVQAFELALSERPDDPKITVELAKALLYIEGNDAERTDLQNAVDAFDQLYREDAAYLDVKQRLRQAYEALGDELLEQEDWCQAETQYIEAALIQPDEALDTKLDLSTERCQSAPQTSAQTIGPTPQPKRRATTVTGSALASGSATVTPPITATTTGDPAPVSGDKIYFSAFNAFESRWEILAVPASGGTPQLVVTHGTMPALSPNGRLLVYRSEARDSIGFHIFDLTSGEDRRITIAQQDMLPRWGGDSTQFLFVAQESTTGLWKVHQGFADGKGDPVILRDGRTPDWSPDNRLIAYQGTDPAGNNPGIYLVPFGGGEGTRLTNHESDRSPDFSPDGSQLAYMSTRNGDWDIYTISISGSAPRQITTTPSQEGLPAWSPDGSKIAYVSDAGSGWNIYVVSAEGGTPTRVAAWDGLNRADWLMAQIWWGRF